MGERYFLPIVLLNRFKHLLLVLAIILVTHQYDYLCYFLLFIYAFYVYLRLNHKLVLNSEWESISDTLFFLSNNFEEPIWGLKIRRNYSKEALEVKFNYEDRFKWEKTSWELGASFYVTLNRAKFSEDKFNEILQYCSAHHVSHEESGGIFQFGHKKKNSDAIFNAKMVLEMIKFAYPDENTDLDHLVVFRVIFLDTCHSIMTSFINFLKRYKNIYLNFNGIISIVSRHSVGQRPLSGGINIFSFKHMPKSLYF